MTNSFPESDAASLASSPPTPTSVATGMRARRVSIADHDYPAPFRELAQPPGSVWAAGALAIATAPAVAIVGTRMATAYGTRVARAIAATCAQHGVCVVSGLARGIDAAAHLGVLEAGGRTVAVLGTGIDIAYPVHHRALQARIASDGLVLTEMAPGERGHGGTFPRRNRLIAALAQLVIVVEAGLKSGTHLTVGHAQELGRRVAAVPGPIDAPQSAGSNRLLRDGADLIAEPADVLSLLSIDASPPAAPLLDDDSARLWHALRDGSADLDVLASRSGLSSRATAAAVSALEISGLIHVDATGRIHATLGIALT